MNVLLVSPSNCVGGAELSLVQLAAFLSQEQIGVYAAMPPSADQRFEHLLRPHVNEILFAKLPTWKRSEQPNLLMRAVGCASRLKRNRTWHFGPIWKLYNFIKAKDISLVHTNTMMVIDPAIAARCAGIPHVQHVREVIGSAQGSLARFPLQRFPRVFMALMDWLHAAVVANSHFTLETNGKYFPPHKARVIYNGVDEGLFNSGRIRPARNGQAVKRIGLVANVTSRVKNHVLFIEAARELGKRRRNLEFCIYGSLPPADDPYFQMLKSSIKEWGLNDTVRFKGLFIDPMDIYDEIDVLVHTYGFESFGRIFIEAMSQGLPVVAVRGGAADELIRNNSNGLLVQQNDPVAMANGIESLVDSPSLYRQIATEARRFAEQFTSEVTGGKILELYRSLLP